MALFISKGDNTSATYSYEYLHRDHIGSIVALSKGTVGSALDVQWQANGAWGERRFQQWSGPLDNALIPASTARGFTDHEHLDSVGLIHMNGRVYDPELGRFLSADPFVQAPYNSQSYNRYSYVFNNPLSFTDPSGYSASCGYSPCSDVEESPSAVCDLDCQRRALERVEDQKNAINASNNAYWQRWANYQSMVADATAGLLYSQAILNGGSYVWKGWVIDTTKEATVHYMDGNGESVELGIGTKYAVRSHPLVVRQSDALRSGKAKHLSHNLSVELAGKVYHVGKTRVDFTTNCESGTCTTTYKAFDGDGYWDPLAPVGFGDGLGGDWEVWGGKGYYYIPYIWSETYVDKFQK